MSRPDKLIYKLYKKVPCDIFKFIKFPIAYVECFIYVKENKFLWFKLKDSFYCKVIVPYFDPEFGLTDVKLEYNNILSIIANQLNVYAEEIIRDFKVKNMNYDSFNEIEKYELK